MRRLRWRRSLLGAWLVCSWFCLWPAAHAGDWKAFSGAEGQAPPALVLPDLDGREVDLAALKGDVVLVNFWATWCEPCRDEMPSLNQLQQRLRGRRFKVLAVNVGEGRARIQQFLASAPVDFAVLRDAESVAIKAWRTRVLPTSFLVDQNGMLRYQLVGAADWNDVGPQAPIFELLDRTNAIGRIHTAGAGKR